MKASDLNGESINLTENKTTGYRRGLAQEFILYGSMAAPDSYQLYQGAEAGPKYGSVAI